LPEREKLTKLSDDKKIEMNECEKRRSEESYSKVSFSIRYVNSITICKSVTITKLNIYLIL
jgi:hypothetical protein